MEDIIIEIKKKKEFSGLEDKFINKELDLLLKRNPNLKYFLNQPRSEKYKRIIKAVRAELRRNYGLFRVGKENKRDKLVEEFKSRQNVEIVKKILSTHASTKERLDKYAGIYHQIFKKTGKPKSVLAFLFKITDIVDKGKGHKNSEILISRTPAQYVVVSFPTITMSGKKMNFPRRRWVELMCERLGYGIESFQTDNEIFYVIRKN